MQIEAVDPQNLTGQQEMQEQHEKPESKQRWLRVPVSALSADALQGLIEEFVSRDGTDYGLQEIALEQKVAQIRCALERGDCAIVFDEDSESCQVVTREMLPDDA